MAATVAAPLERRLGAIAGVTEITSTSAARLEQHHGPVRSAPERRRRGARRAGGASTPPRPTCRADLPTLPILPQGQPGAFPVLILALTSADTAVAGELYDVADTVVAQRIAQVRGRRGGHRSAAPSSRRSGSASTRRACAAMGLSLEAVRTAIAAANVSCAARRASTGPTQAITIATNDQLATPRTSAAIVVRRAAAPWFASPTSRRSSGARATAARPAATTACRP